MFKNILQDEFFVLCRTFHFCLPLFLPQVLHSHAVLIPHFKSDEEVRIGSIIFSFSDPLEFKSSNNFTLILKKRAYKQYNITNICSFHSLCHYISLLSPSLSLFCLLNLKCLWIVANYLFDFMNYSDISHYRSHWILSPEGRKNEALSSVFMYKKTFCINYFFTSIYSIFNFFFVSIGAKLMNKGW